MSLLHSFSLWPRDTLSSERLAEIREAQEDARKSSERVAASLEDMSNQDDPFADFARRARAATWRARN